MKKVTKTKQPKFNLAEVEVIDSEVITKNPKVTLLNTDKIVVIKQENPKRPATNAHANYQLYLDNPDMTVEQFKQKFLDLSDENKKLNNPTTWLRFDLGKGFITLV